MTIKTKRDLNADLALCTAATEGPWYYLAGCIYEPGGRYLFSEDEGAGSTEDFSFIAEARTGWPIAIERAINAERSCQDAMLALYDADRQNERLRSEVESLRMQRDSLEATLQHYRGYA